MKIGVLALQGAFIEHIHKLRQLGIRAVEVRLPQEMAGLDGLIIPGGESTTIGKLMVSYDLVEPIRSFAARKAVWGTCAGMILMAKEVGQDQPVLGLMDIAVDAPGTRLEHVLSLLPPDLLKKASGMTARCAPPGSIPMAKRW